MSLLLSQAGTLLSPPLTSATGQTTRGPLTVATTLVPTDGTVVFDAGAATGGVLTQPLPIPVGFVAPLRIVAQTTNSSPLTLTAPAGAVIQPIGATAVTSLSLGTLASGAPYQQVVLAATDDATWTMVEGMANAGTQIPSGPLSARGPLPVGATYEATDVGVLYQNQNGTIRAIAVTPTSPISLSLPSILGTGQVGAHLTANPGTYQGTPVPTVSYQWARDGAPLTDSPSITAGSQSQVYTVQSGDVGHVLTVQITATNSSGSLGPITSTPLPVFGSSSGQVPPLLGLLNSGGTSLNKGVALSANLAAPSDPASAPYARMPSTNPATPPATQVSEVPGIRIYVHNWSVRTPVQPWLLNADGTLYAAAQGVLGASPPAFPTSTFTLASPIVGFPTAPAAGHKWAGLVWVVGVGYVRYTAYNASTGVFTGCDTRYSGTPASSAKVLQVILPRVEPGNGNSGGGTSAGQLLMRVPGVPVFGNSGQATRIAIQPLTTVEAAGATVAVAAWMV